MRARLVAGLLVGLATSSCAGSAAAPGPRAAHGRTATTVISLQGLHCQMCGAAEVRALKVAPGVLGARFDRDRAEVVVAYDPHTTNPAKLARVATHDGFTGVVGSGHGRYVPDTFPKGEDVAWLAPHGEALELGPRAVNGKVTLFDFYAPWCPPCHQLDQVLAKLLQREPDVALRKLNVVEWGSPLARRYLSEVHALPYVIVYDPTGRRSGALASVSAQTLKGAIEQARHGMGP